MLERFHWLLTMLLLLCISTYAALVRVVVVSAEEGALDHELFLGGAAEERRRGKDLIIGGALLVVKQRGLLRWQRKVLEVELHGLGNTVDKLQSEPLIIFVGYLDRRDSRV